MKTRADLEKAILNSVDSNHIWINAMSLVRPTDEILRDIGASVVRMLKARENLLPAYWPGDGDITELQKLSPTLYLRINAS
jgi:alkyl hydroperoxide reductase subunit AhpC